MRMIPQERAASILKAAVELATAKHYRFVNRADIAKAAGCNPSLVTFYFKDMAQLRSQVVEYGVKHNILPIIAQGIMTNHEGVHGISRNLQRKALLSVNV